MHQNFKPIDPHLECIKSMGQRMSEILRDAPSDAQKKDSGFLNLIVNDIPFTWIADEVLPGRKAEDVYPWLIDR